MDALPLFLLIFSATALGGCIGGVIGYRMARLYYVAVAQRMVRGVFQVAAALHKERTP